MSKPNDSLDNEDISTVQDAKNALKKSQKALERALLRESDSISHTETRIIETAHDIRANLNPIIGYAEILKDEVYGPIGNKKYIESAGILHTSALRLSDICNSILHVSKESQIDTDNSVESSQRDLVDAAETIEEITLLFKEQTTQRNIELTANISEDFPLLKLPPQYLYRALSNIVSNAVKFTPNGGKIIIEANTDHDQGVYIMVIRNTGAGIPADQIMRILKPNKTDKSLSGENGSGLGLPIVNKLMLEIGGTLEILSNGVTTITLKFPQSVT
jgi:two-component system cell cycle sensor histidine kinase PleC